MTRKIEQHDVPWEASYGYPNGPGRSTRPPRSWTRADRWPSCTTSEAWPQPPSRPEPWVTGDVDVPPTLTISVTGDPATPYQGGVNLARALGGSLLTVEGAQHGIALLGQSECVDGIATNYLIDLQTPPDDARRTT